MCRVEMSGGPENQHRQPGKALTAGHSTQEKGREPVHGAPCSLSPQEAPHTSHGAQGRLRVRAREKPPHPERPGPQSHPGLLWAPS